MSLPLQQVSWKAFFFLHILATRQPNCVENITALAEVAIQSIAIKTSWVEPCVCFEMLCRFLDQSSRSWSSKRWRKWSSGPTTQTTVWPLRFSRSTSTKPWPSLQPCRLAPFGKFHFQLHSFTPLLQAVPALCTLGAHAGHLPFHYHYTRKFFFPLF